MSLNQKYIVLISSCLLLLVAVFSLLIPLIDPSLFIIFAVFLIVFTVFFLFLEAIVSYSRKMRLNSQKKTNSKTVPDQILYSARAVFPFQIFPDRYILEENGLYIVRKLFFGMSWTEMISIKDIGSVRLYTGPFFSSITLYYRTIIPQRTFQLRNLWKKDAIRIKEIMDGLLLKQNESIKIPETLPLNIKKKILAQEGREGEVEKEI